MDIVSETPAVLGLLLWGSVPQVELGDTKEHTPATRSKFVWPYSMFFLEYHCCEERNPTLGWKVNVGESSSPSHYLGG